MLPIAITCFLLPFKWRPNRPVIEDDDEEEEEYVDEEGSQKKSSNGESWAGFGLVTGWLMHYNDRSVLLL